MCQTKNITCFVFQTKIKIKAFLKVFQTKTNTCFKVLLGKIKNYILFKKIYVKLFKVLGKNNTFNI